MARFTSHNQLKYSSLKHGDQITFTVNGADYCYTVDSEYCRGTNCGYSSIFDALGIYESRNTIAKESYGYTPSGGGWPQYNYSDYTSLKQFVLRLFLLCDECCRSGASDSEQETTYYAKDVETQYESNYKEGDYITFVFKGKNYEYQVRDRYLNGRGGTDHNSLCKVLGLNNSSKVREFLLKERVCEDHQIDTYEFPVFRDNSDTRPYHNELLNKAIRALYTLIKSKSTKVTHKSNTDVKHIILPQPVTTIRRGQTICGRSISGRPDKITIAVGRIGYKAISDKA